MGGQDGCERRNKVFVKIPKIYIYIFFAGGGGVGLGGQGRREQRSEVFVKNKKIKLCVLGRGGGVQVWVRGQDGCE